MPVALSIAHQIHRRDEEAGVGHRGDVFADRRDALEEARLALIEERVGVDRLEAFDEVVEICQAGRRSVDRA